VLCHETSFDAYADFVTWLNNQPLLLQDHLPWFRPRFLSSCTTSLVSSASAAHLMPGLVETNARFTGPWQLFDKVVIFARILALEGIFCRQKGGFKDGTR